MSQSSNEQVQLLHELVKEKFRNMVLWAQATIEPETPSKYIDAANHVDELGAVECLYILQVVGEQSEAIKERDWQTLIKKLGEEVSSGNGRELVDTARAVRQRTDMHAKFWRYMDLFVELNSNV